MTGAYRYLFVVTYGRSGSTLLMNVLNSIAGFHIAGENTNVLLGLTMSHLAAAETRHKWGRVERGPDHPWFGAERVRPKVFGTRLAKVFIEEVLRPPPDARVIAL